MQKYVNLVDLVKRFPKSIYLKKAASIQPRTSLSKFGGKFNSLFIRLLSDAETTAAREPSEASSATSFAQPARRPLLSVTKDTNEY